MINKITRIFLSVLLFPLFLSSAEFDTPNFQTKLNKLLKGKKFKNVTMGIAICRLPGGDSLFYLNEDEAFMPASTIKLILSAATLKYYKIDHCFQTPICYDSTFQNGVVNGNIYLKGVGSPTILLDSVRQTISRLKLGGLHEIKGNIVYDDLAFKAQKPRFPPYARDRWAPGGALVLNSNRIVLKITSRSPKILFEKVPNTAYARITANLKYSDSTKPSSPDMRYVMKHDHDEYTLNGTVTRWTERINYLALGATRPGLYFATVFKETLKAQGIRVQGKIVQSSCPKGVPTLAYISSPPLRNMLHDMNSISDNIIAENFLSKIGLDQIGAPSDAKKGGQALRQFVNSIVKADDFICADGSGLNPESRISARTFVKLLSEFYQQEWGLLEILHTEGMSTDKLKIRGKSGTLSVRGLNALAGYILPQKSETAYAFVIFSYRQPNPSKLWSGTLTHPVMKVILESINQ